MISGPFKAAPFKVACVAAIALFLAGCGIFGGGSKKVDPKVSEQTARVRDCPGIGIVSQTGTVVRFVPGSAQDLQDLTYRASLGNLSFQCDRVEGGVNVRLGFDVSASRGSAASSNQASFDYFVGVSQGRYGLINKRTYTSSHSFDANGLSLQREYLQVYVPLTSQADLDVYEVLLGFQLSRAELEYNVRH